MPHKEIIEYKGEKVSIITFDTQLDMTKPKKTIIRQIHKLLSEEGKYLKDGKLSKKEG